MRDAGNPFMPPSSTGSSFNGAALVPPRCPRDYSILILAILATSIHVRCGRYVDIP
jgi:hypothetical protein